MKKLELSELIISKEGLLKENFMRHRQGLAITGIYFWLDKIHSQNWRNIKGMSWRYLQINPC